MDQFMARGHVDAFLVSPDGTQKKVACGSNTLLFHCADAVARLFAGDVSYRPRTVAFVYSNADATGLAMNFNAADTNEATRRKNRTQAEIIGTSGLMVHDESIDNGHQFVASDTSKYSGNSVTLRAMTTDNTTAEKIYGFILKDGPGADAHVLAVKKLDDVVPKPASNAISVSWSVTFS